MLTRTAQLRQRRVGVKIEENWVVLPLSQYGVVGNTATQPASEDPLPGCQFKQQHNKPPASLCTTAASRCCSEKYIDAASLQCITRFFHHLQVVFPTPFLVCFHFLTVIAQSLTNISLFSQPFSTSSPTGS